MEKIASFQMDHTKLGRGMYVSRVDFDDIVTYDIRMKVPNKGSYLTPAAAHTFEHLLATYVRNSPVKASIVYAGPMGCQTGFYLLTKGLPHGEAIGLVQDAMAFIATFEGDIPGATEPECGNYLLQDLPAAKIEAVEMTKVLDGWTVEQLKYPA